MDVEEQKYKSYVPRKKIYETCKKKEMLSESSSGILGKLISTPHGFARLVLVEQDKE